MDYYFEREQKLKFDLIDMNCPKHDSYDLIGEIETTMGEIMGSKAQVFTRELKAPKKKEKRGKIIIRAESIKESNEVCFF